MDGFIVLLAGIIIGFVIGLVAMGSTYNSNSLRLANVMNASMLDCVTKQIITKEQVHDIEVIFNKHIELNFKYLKANQDSCKEKE